MHSKPTIYCNISFIHQLFEKCNKSIAELLFETTSSPDVLVSCIKLLSSRNNLVLDENPADLIKSSNPFIKRILKSPSISLQMDPGMSEKVKESSFWNDMVNEIFMLDQSDEFSENIEKEYGMLVLTPTNILLKGKRITQRIPLLLKKNSIAPWQKLSEYKHYMHSMIIVDRYIDHNKEKLANNILPIIKSLSKGNLNTGKIHLTLMTNCDFPNMIYVNLDKLITENKLNINLRIVKFQKDLSHDRFLFTNQLWLTCGIGFNILDKKRDGTWKISQNSTINILPYFSNDELISENENEDTNTNYRIVMSIIKELEKVDEECALSIGNTVISCGEKNSKRFAYAKLNTLLVS